MSRSGKRLQVFLDVEKERIEVPLIMWKLVIDTATNDTVAFFVSNDTKMKEEERARFETICNSVCDELGYNFVQDVKSGCTICCKYEDFVKHIKFIPVQLNKSNLLKNPVHIAKRNEKSVSARSRSRSRSNSPEPTESKPKRKSNTKSEKAVEKEFDLSVKSQSKSRSSLILTTPRPSDEIASQTEPKSNVHSATFKDITTPEDISHTSLSEAAKEAPETDPEENKFALFPLFTKPFDVLRNWRKYLY